MNEGSDRTLTSLHLNLSHPSRRAKGNEADMVYVVGLDNVAKDESNLQLRNQLFVALTRAKGWVKLSGVGSYPLYEEIWRVMRSRGAVEWCGFDGCGFDGGKSGGG